MSNTVNWTTCTVKDVVERHFCGPSPDCEERQIFAPEEWGVLKTTAITWAGWNEKAHKALPRAFWGQPKIEVHAGDVLVTKAGPRNRVGVVCHVPSTRSQLVVSGKMIGLRPISETVNSSFLAGFLATQEPQKYIHDRTTGMAESQVNFANEVLLDAPLRIPPIQEQDLIAKVLDTLDTTISETEAIIDKLKAVKRGLLHDLLTRGIDSNGELRPPQSVAPLLYKDSPLGWIPKEWEVSAAESACDAVIDCKNRTPPIGESGHPVVRTPNVRAGRFVYEGLTFTDDISYKIWTQRGRPRPGDLLITREAPVGEVCLVPADMLDACLGQRMMMYQPNPARLQNNFMLVALLSQPVQRILIDKAGGSTVGHVRVGDIRSLQIPIPPLSEQALIAESYQAIDGRLDTEEQSLAKLYKNKTGLMDVLLTGRVRVTPLLEGTAS